MVDAENKVEDHRSEREHFHEGTWMSLLGLLRTYEFFVTVDQTPLWRRHVAWAKPKGKEMRDYITQRFASNMVFLSLLLGSAMSTLMNSASFATDIRTAMQTDQYGSVKFYLGCVLTLDACVSVIGLVATFTAWGMISAISDSNSHALLRSSMGQYVTSLPSRFVVASLYLFLLWLILLIVELMSGPALLIMVGTVVCLFLQVVVAFSAFGRLIIHTGAMGKKRVLDPDFERCLLPSGLHASLLIKATERVRRRTSVTSQYKGRNSVRREIKKRRSAPTTMTEEENSALLRSAKAFSGDKQEGNTFDWKELDTLTPPNLSSSRRSKGIDAVEVVEMVFPKASCLKRPCLSELKGYSSPTARTRARRQSALVLEQTGSDKVGEEWSAEQDVRETYGIEPPINSFDTSDDDNDDEYGEYDNEYGSDFESMPRISVLNRSERLSSLRRLIVATSDDADDDSDEEISDMAEDSFRSIMDVSLPSIQEHPKTTIYGYGSSNERTYSGSSIDQSPQLSPGTDEEQGQTNTRLGERQFLLTKMPGAPLPPHRGMNAR